MLKEAMWAEDLETTVELAALALKHGDRLKA